MGIYNRDYYRQSSGFSQRFGGSTMTMTQKILIATVIVFILQNFLTIAMPTWRIEMNYASRHQRAQAFAQAEELDRDARLTGDIRYVPVLEHWGSVIPRAVERGEVWRLVSYAFLHSRQLPIHIIFNMMALWSFGPLMESMWGRREFLGFYLGAAIVAGIAHVVLGLIVGAPAGAVGASGSIMGLLMAFAFYYPYQPVTLFIFTMEARFLILLYVVWDSFPVLQMLMGRAGVGMGVAHAAHLGGLAFGYLYCASGWKLTGWLDQWLPTRGRRSPFQPIMPRSSQSSSQIGKWWSRLFKSRPNLKVHTEPSETEPEKRTERAIPQNLDRRVDEVLKKIKDVGEANITEEERDVLREAAKRYRRD